MQKLVSRAKQATHRLLRKSEKYTKTDMVYLAKGGFWLSLAQVASSLATFLLAIAFANLIPKETYGTYKYVLSIAGVLALTTLKGMDGAVNQATAQGKEGSFFPALKEKLRFGLIGGISSLFIAGYYFVNHNNILGVSFLIISIFIPFLDSFILYDSFLQGKRLFRDSALSATITQIASTLVIICSIFITKNIYVILISYFLSWTLLRLVFLIRTIRKYPPNNEVSPETLSYGKHTTIINIGAALMGSIDSVLLFHFLGPIHLAIYSFALAPVSQLRSVLDKMNILTVPKFAKRSVFEIQQTMWPRILFLFIAGVTISFMYIFGAPFFYKILFPKYVDSVIYSQIFSLSLILLVPFTVLSSALSARLTDISKKDLYLWNIPSVITTISTLALIGPLGIMGVVIGRLISNITNVGIGLFLWRKLVKTNNPV